MARFFKLTDVEQDRAQRFENYHLTHGETISYIFTFAKSGRGMVLRIKCGGCNKSESITDFTS
jgi:uncharacterized protein CbrC (UPF0167 family)